MAKAQISYVNAYYYYWPEKLFLSVFLVLPLNLILFFPIQNIGKTEAHTAL